MKSKIAAVLAIFSTVAYVDSANTNTDVIEKKISSKEVRHQDPVVEYTLDENKAKIKYGIQEVRKIEATSDEVEKAKLRSKFIQEMGLDVNEFQNRFMKSSVQAKQANITINEMTKNYGSKALSSKLDQLEQNVQPVVEIGQKAKIANRPKLTYRA